MRRTAKALFLSLAIGTALSLPVLAAPKPSFEIVSSSKDRTELRFRNVQLIARRADDAQNQLGLNFAGAVDSELYDQLQRALPNWIDTAFGAYDSGVIRAKRPVVFETRNETDGFSLRMTVRAPQTIAEDRPPTDIRQTLYDTRNAVEVAQRIQPPPNYPAVDNRPTSAITRPDVTLRASTDITPDARRFIVVSLAERPDDQTLLTVFALAARTPPLASLWGGFRQNKGGRLAGGGGRFGFPVFDELKLTGSFGYVDAEGSLVRRTNGTRAPFSDSAMKGSVGFAYVITGGEIGGEAVLGKEGVGGILSAAFVAPDNYVTLRAAYHEPYDDTVEAVAMGATRDGATMSGGQDLGGGFWADGEIRAARYGVKGDSDVGTMIGVAAGLRYLTEFSGIPASFGYRFDADYVLDSGRYPGVAPTPFTPLALRDREVHRLSAALSVPLMDDLILDLHAGYALDRYGAGGGFAGGQFRARLTSGLQLVAAGRYSAVSTRIGERGPESLFSLSLALSDQ